MGEAFDIDILRRNLAAAMDKRGKKPTSLSLEVGKSPTLVKDLMEKSGDTKLSTIFRLADALNVTVDSLLTAGVEPMSIGPRLFVKGEVAAGQWVEAYEWPRDEWQTLTGRPDVSADLDHRFFLRVSGDSMNEVYPEGTFVECVSTFGRAEIQAGKRVVVVRTREDQRFEATVKEMVEIDGEAWFVPRSTNPAHRSFKADDPGDGIVEVRIAAIVVSSVRPE